MRLPIIPHHRPSPPPAELQRAVRLAEKLREEKQLQRFDQFKTVACQQLDDAPTLHIDDYSEIPLLRRERDAIYMQQRACLRAAPGDWVATTHPIDPDYQAYFEQQLRMHPIQWLVAESVGGPTKLALACIRSREARRQLHHAVRRSGLRYIHPHYASLDVWELAAWLREFTRRPVQVIGPPVAVCRFANDKVEFADLVTRLLGDAYVPKTAGAYCLATLSHAVREFAEAYPYLGVKIPNGVGGYGNLFVAATDIHGKSLLGIHDYLTSRLQESGLPTTGRLLVDVWQTEVLKTGSVQTWIPPIAAGPPVIEGLFEQKVMGEQGHFVGCRPLDASMSLSQQIVDQSFLLTTVFQRLGYVGRCSFDFILLRDDALSNQVQFLECNGRWGGTSAPMSFVNRLMGDYQSLATIETRRLADPEFAELTFSDLAARFGGKLYDARTGTGNTVLFNPARATIRSEIDTIRWQAKSHDSVGLTSKVPDSVPQE